MAKRKNNQNEPVKQDPALYKGVMVSSTFKDLQQHRAELMNALRKEKLVGVGMEDYVVNPDDDVISSSLNMVREGTAYIGLISHRYGHIPECPDRNPDAHSICRLEFEQAQELNRPTLIFIMGDDHDVKPGHVETDPEKIEKLKAYRNRAKEGRIYVTFESLKDFTHKAIHAVASLRRYLKEQDEPSTPQPQDTAPDPEATKTKTKTDPIPAPPHLYAEPPYIGSHDFVGRKAQLDTLDDWAAPADPHPVLLFEAIGGAGKSMLTWEWVNKHAKNIRKDWAGIVWYSFYERGAIMADFCQHALAYMTDQPLKDFRKKKTPELAELLIHQLQDRPWLIVFDGLERVLVAYHRIDAAQITDEEAGIAGDQIAHRDPCIAIRPEDDELLRSLAGASPSKLLLTSRLIPRVLLNDASQPIPGVLRDRLPGLRPRDAETLFRACGITGDSKDIQNYLKTHCDCHPLVIGILAGLVNHYLPDRGNFDAWAADSAGGGKLNLAKLNLVQKRNHILCVALAALDDKSHQLLSTLALLSEAIDYPALSAFNPHLPPEPKAVDKPENPEANWTWQNMPNKEKEQAIMSYQTDLKRWGKYNQALKVRLGSPEFLAASQKLPQTVRDLEGRGLLQYDRQTKRYDLHPVVRGVAAGRLAQKEKRRYGQCVVDHFSRQGHSPYNQAETLDDLREGLCVVRTLLQMGHRQQACDTYYGDLSNALHYNLEAHAEILSLLHPFFSKGWSVLPTGLEIEYAAYLANNAANALSRAGELEEAFAAYSACLLANLKQENWSSMRTCLSNISHVLIKKNLLAKRQRCILLALDLATESDDKEYLFRIGLERFSQFVLIGQWPDAEAMWQILDPMGRNWPRRLYSPGDAESVYAFFCFFQGKLTEEHLTCAEQLARAGKNRMAIRNIHSLRGQWQLEQGQYNLAAASLGEAVHMARETSLIDQDAMMAEALLALANFHLDRLPNPRYEVEHLAKGRYPFYRGIAELWLAIGDRELAKKHALDAYKWAWADGEPYVNRYELNKSSTLLKELGADIPDLPPYDPAKDEKFPWEDKVSAAIEKLKAENEAKKPPEEY